MNKIKVAVLYGGRSSEHEVSLLSAINVMQNLDPAKFEVVPIGIDKQGGWYVGDSDVLKAQALKISLDPNKRLFSPELLGSAGSPNAECLFDVVFPVIHGPLCEDGIVQGFLEMADVPYVGCGVLASAVGMDKDVAKRLAREAGLKVGPYLCFKQGEWQEQQKALTKKIQQTLKFPMFVKPANTGSSIGVHKVKTLEALQEAIEDAFVYDSKVLVEQGIDARELEVSVLESLRFGADPIVSVIGEIKPQNSHEFYSYAAKYLDESGAALDIPAVISSEIAAAATQMAKTVFKALECEGMARVDLFLDKHTNEIFFNELNTIPGFTQISMYPKLLGASGIEYRELLTHLIELAMKRYQRQKMLRREYVAACSA